MKKTPTSAKRTLVVGTSCAGKSTFARRLAGVSGATWIELDELFWSEHWRPKPQEEFARLVGEATAGPAWIADGNYGHVREVLWPQAERLVWLNYGKPRVFWRSLKRSIRRCLSNEPLWHGNRETFRKTFLSRDSILLWVLTTFERRRRELTVLRKSAAYPHLEWIEFTHPRQAERWLSGLEQAGRHQATPEIR
ncbi:MAG: hypothetical protein P8Y78_00995 [Acidihalobacter sp.]